MSGLGDSDESRPTLNSLAAKISELSETLTQHLKDNNVAQPTFAADSPTSYSGITSEIFLIRQKLLDACTDLQYLASGPSESIFNYAHTCMPDVACLGILNYFDFWAAVPLDGSASYDEIAKHTSLPRDAVQRVLEHATTLRLFEYTNPRNKHVSDIRQTARSAALAKSSGLRALVSTILQDAGPAMTVMPDALQRYSRGQASLPTDMSKTAFAMMYSGGGFFGNYNNSWELLENDGEGLTKGWRQRNFVEFMRYIKEIFSFEQVVLEAVDWKAAGSAKVVDIGGSGGHDAIFVAEKFPQLDITVQDLPEVGPVFEKNVPQTLKSRLRFQAHDFFQPQPVQADIYLLKLILHDWPEEECVRILRGLIPALKPGAKVIWIDYIGKQDAGVDSEPLPRSIQAMGTATDMRMMALFAAEERSVESWKKIFHKADERFEIARVEANPLTFIAVMELVWRG